MRIWNVFGTLEEAKLAPKTKHESFSHLSIH
ncbi:hypothetical protein Pint_17945 [Pistacia integerrima]|uniref:Uncharacterized protein n=1 Tax=Pistacia integerrima TaxID=434235 RepID=A0ACC0YVP4_9ROSI|nr:hypothetical protein Pint_17945 [Pistacia integerrima]